MNELVVIENDIAKLDETTGIVLAELERKIKQLKDKQEEIKNSVLKEMESKKIIQIKTDELTINYIAPTTRETLDSKKLREDNPDLYDEYIKISPVKSSIRIKLN